MKRLEWFELRFFHIRGILVYLTLVSLTTEDLHKTF